MNCDHTAAVRLPWLLWLLVDEAAVQAALRAGRRYGHGGSSATLSNAAITRKDTKPRADSPDPVRMGSIEHDGQCPASTAVVDISRPAGVPG